MHHHPLLSAVARVHHTTVKALVGPSKKRHIVNARTDVAVRLRKLDWSYDAIGEQLGGRDHATIMNLCDRSLPQTLTLLSQAHLTAPQKKLSRLCPITPEVAQEMPNLSGPTRGLIETPIYGTETPPQKIARG